MHRRVLLAGTDMSVASGEGAVALLLVATHKAVEAHTRWIIVHRANGSKLGGRFGGYNLLEVNCGGWFLLTMRDPGVAL